jgi:hypothetical protein
MPLPTPTKDESQDDFISRCHSALSDEFTETDQRNAVCFRQWREGRGSGDSVERKAREKFGSDKFVKVADVPIFAEHTTKDREGNVVVYDKAALQAIATRCNERILDTNDFCPITNGHTPDEEQARQGAESPDIVGYAGNFHLGMIGNKSPRWAIFTDEYHFADEHDKLAKKPRRSVEIWTEDRMEDRFFDPIAALGAETPRLDLGLVYAKRQAANGRFVQKYAARSVRVKYQAPGGAVPVAPGAMAVSPKKFGTNGKKRHEAQPPATGVSREDLTHANGGSRKGGPSAPPTGTSPKSGIPGAQEVHYAAPEVEAPAGQVSQPNPAGGGKLSMPITPDDCKTIVDALESLDWVQETKELLPRLRQLLGEESEEHASPSLSPSEPSFSPSGESPSGSPFAEEEEHEHEHEPSLPSGSPSPIPEESPAEPSFSPSGEEESPSEESPSGSPERHAAGDEPSQEEHCAPVRRMQAPPEPAPPPKGSPPGAPMGGEEVPPGGAAKKGRKYASSTGSVEGNVKEPKGATAVGTIDKTTGATVASPEIMRMRRHGSKERHSRSYLRLKEKYNRLKSRVERIEATQEDVAQTGRLAERYALLEVKQREGYVFDLETELRETADLSDEQFRLHLQRVERYQRAPVGAPRLPTPDLPQARTLQPSEQEKRLKERILKKRDEQNKEFERYQRQGGTMPRHKDFFELQKEAQDEIAHEGTNGKQRTS